MHLNITFAETRNTFAQIKPIKGNSCSLETQKDYHMTHDIAMVQKANVMPAISFGSLKEVAIAKEFEALAAKYSAGETPLILSIKPGSIQRIAKKIITTDKPIVVGVAGQTAAGKSTFLEKAQETLGDYNSGNNPLFTIIRGDDYYHDISERKRKEGLPTMFKSGFSFDVPDAINLSLLNEDLGRLSKGEVVKTPIYDSPTGTSSPSAKTVLPSKLIMLDSIFSLNEKVRNSLDISVYIESPFDIMESRFLRRAVEKRGKTVEEAKMQFADANKKAQQYIVPNIKFADVILSGQTSLEKISNFYRDLFEILKPKSQTSL